jgi:hypothetical protein
MDVTCNQLLACVIATSLMAVLPRIYSKHHHEALEAYYSRLFTGYFVCSCVKYVSATVVVDKNVINVVCCGRTDMAVGSEDQPLRGSVTL